MPNSEQDKPLPPNATEEEWKEYFIAGFTDEESKIRGLVLFDIFWKWIEGHRTKKYIDDHR